MKKLISIALALCLLISAVPFAVSAAESGAPVGDTYVCDDFEYTVDGDDFAKVIKYLGSETDVVVPSRLDGHFVSTIGRGAFAESLTVKSVSFIGGYVFEDYCLGPSVSAVDLPTNSREETLPILDKYEITMPGGKKAVVSMKNLTLYSYPPTREKPRSRGGSPMTSSAAGDIPRWSSMAKTRWTSPTTAVITIMTATSF